MSDLEGLAAITNLAGLRRWGYITIDEGSADDGTDPVVRPTRGGRHAQRVWAPLAAEIEGRWRGRFGAEAVGALRGRLDGLAGRLGRDLPWYLPGVAQGMFARAPALSDRVRDSRPGRLRPVGAAIPGAAGLHPGLRAGRPAVAHGQRQHAARAGRAGRGAA